MSWLGHHQTLEQKWVQAVVVCRCSTCMGARTTLNTVKAAVCVLTLTFLYFAVHYQRTDNIIGRALTLKLFMWLRKIATVAVCCRCPTRAL